MDSLTQGLLGAATFAVVKDKAIGKQALLIGAIAGTIPDLDVLLSPLFNEIEFLSVHRSISHSIGFALILSILLGEFFHRLYKRKHQRAKWNVAFFIALFTHSMLDWFTTYGTKLISPFNNHLFSLNSMHIFEPVFTSILLVGVLWHLIQRKPIEHHNKVLKNALYLSVFYLLLAVSFKNHAYYHFEGQLKKDGVDYQEILVSPTPLNIILWHGIVKTKNGYLFSTYSIFDGKKELDFQFVKSDHTVIERIQNNQLIQYYLEYTQGFPLIESNADGEVKIYAIKYGPINYYGAPEFVYPLCFNEFNLDENKVTIDYSGKQRGPVKNFKNLFKRIIGIKKVAKLVPT